MEGESSTTNDVIYSCYCIFSFFISVEESLFFINLNLENVIDFSSLYDSCRSQVPDIPYAMVSIVNETNAVSGRDYFYCRVETERGIFRSSSVIFQGGSVLLFWKLPCIRILSRRKCRIYTAEPLS